MSRNRKPEYRSGDVPPELLDLGNQTWRDSELFGDWCRRHDLEELEAKSWYQRFTIGRDLWALHFGHTLVTSTSGQRGIDHRRLKDAGVPWAGALTRAMCRAEYVSADPVAFRATCDLVPYGSVPDEYPRMLPRAR